VRRMNIITRPIDNNPITLLLLRHGSVVLEPPAGFTFIVDENNKLLRDERGAYLLDIKEE